MSGEQMSGEQMSCEQMLCEQIALKQLYILYCIYCNCPGNVLEFLYENSVTTLTGQAEHYLFNSPRL